MWITINEPMVVTMFGYALGAHAPGKHLLFEALPVAHHQLLGHGRAAQALRAAGAESIGIASNHAPTWPASESEEDRAAAGLYDNLVNWMFADPVILGEYPNGIGDGMPGPVAEDLAVIGGSVDWFGINYYQPARIRKGSPRSCRPSRTGTATGFHRSTSPRTGARSAKPRMTRGGSSTSTATSGPCMAPGSTCAATSTGR